MRQFEKRVVVTEAHEFPMLWWYRIIPYRSYVALRENGPFSVKAYNFKSNQRFLGAALF